MSDQTVYLLPQELSIMNIEECAAQIFDQLREATSGFQLDGSQLSRVDTAGVQLLCVLFAQAEKEQKTISWHASSETLVQTVKLLGLGQTLSI